MQALYGDKVGYLKNSTLHLLDKDTTQKIPNVNAIALKQGTIAYSSDAIYCPQKLTIPNVRQFAFSSKFCVTINQSSECQVWDLNGKLLASTQNVQANFISFDPSNPYSFCVSGPGCSFFKIKPTLSQFLLVQQKVPLKSDIDKYDLKKKPEIKRPWNHVWYSDHTVYATSEDGQHVYHITEQECDILPFFDSVDCLAINKIGFVLGNESSIRITNFNAHVYHTIQVDSPITHLSSNLDYSHVLVGDASGQYFKMDLTSFSVDRDIQPTLEPLVVLESKKTETQTAIIEEEEEEQDTRVDPSISKIQEISQRIIKLIEKNETVDELERLDREEFIIDFQERDRLIQVADKQISDVRESIENENIKQKIIFQRLKEEFWDSMDVVGQTLHSFYPEPLTGQKLIVENFAIPKVAENKLHTKITRLLRLQKSIQGKSIEDLLYKPHELTTNERRRTQMLLLGGHLNEIKQSFNETFATFLKLKTEEISKINEKNERISTILAQLNLTETIPVYQLEDDEVPDRVITVFDSEVKSEKFMTLEEKRKLEEKKRLEEERNAAGHDNWRERALMQMMNGKLEDRTEQEQQEVIEKPAWLNKNKEDLTDEEKKLMKEYEKKMAVLKEEQDKYRKALETELRKCQSLIVDIANAFDNKLKELAQLKLSTCQKVLSIELFILKLARLCTLEEADAQTQANFNALNEQLKQEKHFLSNELLDIKRELEKSKEEYDVAAKKDREVEKTFKKEFTNEPQYDGLYKLFKKRTVNEPLAAQPLNPFELIDYRTVEQLPLDPSDIQVPTELWLKLVEFRDKKIASEKEALLKGKKHQELQKLAADLSKDLEQNKIQSEQLLSDILAFEQNQFARSFDLETFYTLKQGQVEVPQGRIFTDYEDAILIHKSNIEKLNDVIRTLGNTQVEALTEMKNYRKGIHALEWENKRLDFEAEGLLLKIKDLQLLRMTKDMQEYLRNGNDQKQGSQIAALEKRSEFSKKAHEHLIQEKQKIIQKLETKISTIDKSNVASDKEISQLETNVVDRSGIHQIQVKKHTKDPLKDVYNRRKLVDLAKSQAQDIAILRQEVERLRLKTYPAFPAAI